MIRNTDVEYLLLLLRTYPNTEQIAMRARNVGIRIVGPDLHGGICGYCISVKVSPNPRSGVGAFGAVAAEI